ncbi:MAG: hypothetical protein ACRDM1_08240 [Gaiellaceae bacterium]
MDRRRRGRSAVAASVAALAAVLAARILVERGGAARLASFAINRLRYGARKPARPEESRLYARGRHRLEAHLVRRGDGDGDRIVLALPVDGSVHSAVYSVDESRPWRDFERQSGLLGAAWGPCRDASAGL